MEFSERLQELRLERGITRTAVALSCKLSTQCISALEMGKRNPTGSTIIMLSDFFGVSADYLLGRTDELGAIVQNQSPAVLALSRDEQKLLKNFRAMRADLQPNFIEMSEKLAQTSDAIAGKTQKNNA